MCFYCYFPPYAALQKEIISEPDGTSCFVLRHLWAYSIHSQIFFAIEEKQTKFFVAGNSQIALKYFFFFFHLLDKKWHECWLRLTSCRKIPTHRLYEQNRQRRHLKRRQPRCLMACLRKLEMLVNFCRHCMQYRPASSTIWPTCEL